MFVYIQSLMIMMLEILCCKIFFEAFGIKREENNCWKNYSIVYWIDSALLFYCNDFSRLFYCKAGIFNYSHNILYVALS